ncbi:MAG: hypothetical protein ACI8S3_000019 [Alphaproteobacteria bacterium]
MFTTFEIAAGVGCLRDVTTMLGSLALAAGGIAIEL